MILMMTSRLFIQPIHQYIRKAIEILNIGGEQSNRTLVYCNSISEVYHPDVNEIRIQDSDYLEVISPGGDQTVNFEFELVKLHAEEVSIIEIIVDSKNFVKECNENNNTTRWSWPS